MDLKGNPGRRPRIRRECAAMPAQIASQVDLAHHVLLTEPGAEFKAARHLRANGFSPYVPSERVTKFRTVFDVFRRASRVAYEAWQPIFRGYLILPLNMVWSFGPIYITPGLRQRPFLQICGKPAVLSDADVERLKGAEEALKSAPIEGLPYQVGDTVRYLDGPFAGHAALIARLDDRERIELLMEMLGGKVTIHTSARHIESLTP